MSECLDKHFNQIPTKDGRILCAICLNKENSDLRAKLLEQEMAFEVTKVQLAKQLCDLSTEHDELSGKTGELEKYAELGRLAIEVKGRTCSKGTFETVTDGTCINCERFNFCQKRAELLAEVQS